MTPLAVWLAVRWPAGTAALITASMVLSPFLAADQFARFMFRRDERKWLRAWDAYIAADIPRPSVLGNVAPRGARDDPGNATDIAVEDAATEVISDD